MRGRVPFFELERRKIIMLRRAYQYFTTQEKILWCASVGAILLSFFLLEGTQYLTLAASLIGVT